MVFPNLQQTDAVVRIIGLPTFLGGLIWLIRTYERGTAELKNLVQRTTSADSMISTVNAKVDTIQNNHLAHLQETSNQTVAVLQEINTGIQILVDRTPRKS